MKQFSFPLVCALSLAGSMSLRAADDLVVADFEEDNYGRWQAQGEAFGNKPARGTLPGQMEVSGFQGRGLANSFVGGDKSTGTLTSPPFKIERTYLGFLIGGGGYAGETCLNLRVGDRVVRTAVGPNLQSGGSERLQPAGWDVRELAGQEAVLEIVDRRTGGWGHINVDHIIQTDRRPPVENQDVLREMAVTERYLWLPVKNGAAMKKVEVLRGGRVATFFDIELADGAPDWWAFLDTSAWLGGKIGVKVNRLRDDSKALEQMRFSAEAVPAAEIYREPLRPQLHFSPRRGWNNDPNGMVFYRGEYHLFFQHNPYGWNWGNMHWGHAVSSNLVHWRELPEALYPDSMGPMFSGSAVVDWKNTSGFGQAGQPPLVLAYTAAGDPTVQCLAYSTDGRTFTKFAGNPVVSQITGGNRDPKLIWHEPTRRWIQTLYVGFDENKDGRRTTRHTIHFFASPDLKNWTKTSETEGFFECPDFFELPVENQPGQRKWILTGASSEYMVGTFDGQRFIPESPKLPGHRGKGFYAAQTFSDLPDGRRIQIGWLQAPSPGMPFNQCMSLPLELKLQSTSDGLRLTWTPISLPASAKHEPATVAPLERKSLTAQSEGLLAVQAEFEPGPDSELTLRVNGLPVIYNSARQEISVNGHRAPAPLRAGRQKITVFADRTVLEVFASDGLTYVPLPVIAKAGERGASVELKGAALKSQRFQASELKSIW